MIKKFIGGGVQNLVDILVIVSFSHMERREDCLIFSSLIRMRDWL